MAGEGRRECAKMGSCRRCDGRRKRRRRRVFGTDLIPSQRELFVAE